MAKAAAEPTASLHDIFERHGPIRPGYADIPDQRLTPEQREAIRPSFRSPAWDPSHPPSNEAMTAKWRELNPNVSTLSADDMRAAMKRIEEGDDTRRRENAERVAHFYEQIPKALHGHELITTLASVIQFGEPLHPDDHKRLADQLAHLLREHAKEQEGVRESGLWVPGDPL